MNECPKGAVDSEGVVPSIHLTPSLSLSFSAFVVRLLRVLCRSALTRKRRRSRRCRTRRRKKKKKKKESFFFAGSHDYRSTKAFLPLAISWNYFPPLSLSP
jgi:hypothetical protein